MNTRVRASAECRGSGILSRAETPRCGGVFTGLTGLRMVWIHGEATDG